MFCPYLTARPHPHPTKGHDDATELLLSVHIPGLTLLGVSTVSGKLDNALHLGVYRSLGSYRSMEIPVQMTQ